MKNFGVPNQRAALGAGRTRCFHLEARWPGPSEHQRSAQAPPRFAKHLQ
jgi:hypothetical protein